MAQEVQEMTMDVTQCIPLLTARKSTGRNRYNRITFTKSLSVCITTFSANSQKLRFLLPQSRDSSCHVSRPILATPSLWLHKHTDLCVHNSAHSPGLWHQPRLTNVAYAWSWRLCGITPAIHIWSTVRGLCHTNKCDL